MRDYLYPKTIKKHLGPLLAVAFIVPALLTGWVAETYLLPPSLTGMGYALTTLQTVLILLLLLPVIHRRLIRPLKILENQARQLADGTPLSDHRWTGDDELGRAGQFLEKSEERLSSLFASLNREQARVTSTEKELEDRLQLQQVLFEAVPIPLFYKNRQGIFVQCNRAFEKFIGRDRKEFLGKNVYEISPRNLADVYDAADQDLYDNPDSIQHYETTVVSSTGEGRNVVFYKALVPGEKGKARGLIGAILDVTEKLKTETMLREVNKTLEARVAQEVQLHLKKEACLARQAQTVTMGRLARALTHQWRQPLNALSIYIQSLDGEKEPAVVRQTIERAMDKIDYLTETMIEFRNFFRLKEAPREMDLREVLTNLLHFFTPQMTIAKISLETQFPPHPVAFFGNEGGLRQVFIHLLLNAQEEIEQRRTLEKSEIPGEIQIRLRSMGEKVIVSIEDNGGRNAEALSELFEPQESGPESGLAFASLIVQEQLGGSLKAFPGEKGAQVELQLPSTRYGEVTNL